ncbi:hypothetical protein Taro_022906 [Colocasia esculenta]|uniref:Uncharacterized protein n=1 Tax=Colocasia esculenta TaxID=4460 RepID=A0A843V501_COLES|nr:hypothetical protein [Colocasia esculenta]
MWLLGVSRGNTWLFLPNLVEVRDVGACVVRLWSHVATPVFRELLCHGECVPRWLAFQQGPSVSCRRVLLMLLGARAASVVAIFARAVVGFILVLRVRMGVVKSERAYMWCGLHRCRVVVRGTGRRCPCLVGSPLIVGVRFPQNCVVLVSGCCGIGLEVEVHRLAACVLWDFVCPQGREVGFVSRTLWALLDGSLVSAMGVWLVVLLWKCQSRLVVSPCMWKRLVMRVLLPCFPLVAPGDDAPLWCCVAKLFGERRGCSAGCASCGSASLALLFPLSCEEEAYCVPSSSAFRGLLGVVVLSHGIWCHVAHRGNHCGKGPSPCAILRLSWLFPSYAWFPSGLLWRVLPVSRVISVIGATVLHLAKFGACGGTLCSCSSGLIFMSSGALVHCVALWVALGACVSTVCCVVFPDRELCALFHEFAWCWKR